MLPILHGIGEPVRRSTSRERESIAPQRRAE
jgi:hypothetical protein